MKVACDVCGSEEAALYCCADEAALCSPCDRRVHRANKLAGKHRRLSLLPPSSPPLCDVCQEKRAFVFCQEDRAILCRDCDGPIHSANHLTMNHSRFLLTGLRLSSSAAPDPEEPFSEKEADTKVQQIQTHQPMKPSSAAAVSTTTTTSSSTNSGATNSSSISEYLIKTLPGWCVDDFLVDDAAAVTAAGGFSQMNEPMLFLEADFDGGSPPGAPTEELPIWVPHVPQTPTPAAASSGGAAYHHHHHLHQVLGFKDINAGAQVGGFSLKPGRERWSDDAFQVPQISPVAAGNANRPRPSPWYL